MTLPASGQLTMVDIWEEVYADTHTTQQIDMSAIDTKTGIGTDIASYYGYTLMELSVSPDELTFDATGDPVDLDTVTVTATATNSWNAVNTGYTWITVTGGSGTGNGSFAVEMDAYVGGRVGFVTVDSAAPDKLVRIIQSA